MIVLAMLAIIPGMIMVLAALYLMLTSEANGKKVATLFTLGGFLLLIAFVATVISGNPTPTP